MSWKGSCDSTERSEPTVKITKPRLYSFTRPNWSAILPTSNSPTVGGQIRLADPDHVFRTGVDLNAPPSADR
ncbi:MAG TPA: hypothetical protein VED17_10120 [Nitrososphaerales archaeon]|nr:hypothetical protein [Nitrososphaerales archaeon]